MASPKGCHVEIAGLSFNAFAVNIAFAHEGVNRHHIVMGHPVPLFELWANMHDTKNLPYEHLNRFLDLGVHHIAENKVEMKLMLLGDEDDEVLITASFNGGISKIILGTTPPPYSRKVGAAPEDFNHIMYLELYPEVDAVHGINVGFGN